ncbi:Phosphate regulon sensor protein PhoR [Planctopirus ephydatiae]|jgi:two-component system phosphate regulon sensor histidine kinase PhoR|uniref:histidine kinase n=1 Tax=Planctopirus ephydatiae TaxID=2528019 RepID=A0A518GIQ5_9PLAN|nr:HAMP domain-containing sensor histidine kinase [Planctopirus ephydatiae]QDV28469.1 Phosphate regulon sensor protein PhoR [Planctopirus ephydatiae]
MSALFRKRRTLHLPITLSVTLIVLNVTLMVVWIVLFAQNTWWAALVLGVVVFTLILTGLSIYMVLMIKEVRLNQRQANFVDAVTHELKSPIASLSLHLETLSLRSLSDDQRQKFYATMERELERLDHLITQLLDVGRLNATGTQAASIDLILDTLLRSVAQEVAGHYRKEVTEIFQFDIEAAVLRAPQIVVETIFRNLFDNAIKYGGHPPLIFVEVRAVDHARIVIRVTDNGAGVAPEDRKRIFQMFYRAGNELQRRTKGTGLGLYIVQTLVRQLNGRIHVHPVNNHSWSLSSVRSGLKDLEGKPLETGTTFELILPGRVIT